MARGSPNIQFLGQQSREHLKVLYRNAVALLYPSANFQVGIPASIVSTGHGAPLVIMEAFSQGTPVIASNLGRIPALLEQTGGGLVYSCEQQLLAAVDRLLSDPTYRDDLGVRGNEAYRQNWTPNAHLAQYLALIEEIGNKRAGQGSESNT
jgi:glycosyltransferase involved in cell wall biosynthesis